MSILDDVGSLLITDGVAFSDTTVDWALFKSYQPESPDKCITLYETGGPTPDQTNITTHTFPSFQVRGRGAEFGYAALRTKMQAVFDSLNNSTISGYVFIYAENSGPLTLGYDKSQNRPELVWNFSTMKT